MVSTACRANDSGCQGPVALHAVYFFRTLKHIRVCKQASYPQGMHTAVFAGLRI